MATTTFAQYTWNQFEADSDDGLAVAGVDWDAYGVDWQKVVAAAGMDPDDDEIGVGILTRDWNGHPEGAVIVSGLTIAGYPFAVSTEA